MRIKKRLLDTDVHRRAFDHRSVKNIVERWIRSVCISWKCAKLVLKSNARKWLIAKEMESEL